MTTHDEASAEGTVIVAETGTAPYTQQITAGRHRLIADEPATSVTTPGPTHMPCCWPRWAPVRRSRCV
ncbi:hypothetical protein [Mycobacterium tilburgii]|uniref:hypothetical protein n=1 Tax=Mycobacterium tilburgii TaxID=44467 RepID=UPI0028C4A996|nr:hypothetical protein [Mycobacterium tilburgii]